MLGSIKQALLILCMQALFHTLLKPLLKVMADPVEKNREVATTLIHELVGSGCENRVVVHSIANVVTPHCPI